MLLLLLACTPASTPSGKAPSDTADTGEVDRGTAEYQFTFAIVADPHVVGEGDHLDRLRAALDDIAGHDGVAVTFVLGDIEWGDGLTLVPPLLAEQAVPTVPIIGDNEILDGDEETFDTAYAGNFEALASLDGWNRLATPVDNPDWARPSWFQDYSFDLGGVHFSCQDWNSRDFETAFGETPDLHDFDSGTFPWFAADIAAVDPTYTENVVLLSHMPIFPGPGGFDMDETATIEAVMAPLSDQLFASFGGHFHSNSQDDFPELGIEVYVTDATWDDENTVRYVEVWRDDVGFSYVQDLVVID